jgi:hypothetical protein
MSTGRANACCGVVKRMDGREEIVVAGGTNEDPGHEDQGMALKKVEIYSVEESRWRSGSKLTQNFTKILRKKCIQH